MLSKNFFAGFPALWEGFEQRFKEQFMQWCTPEQMKKPQPFHYELKQMYEIVGYAYWLREEKARQWEKQYEAVFFENRHYTVSRMLYAYDNLDELASKSLETVWLKTPERVWKKAVKPHMDARKQELIEKLAQLEQEYRQPVLYDLVLPAFREEAYGLAFQSSHKKCAHGSDLTGYAYTLNGREYKDVRSFCKEKAEELSEGVYIRKDIYGEKCLSTYTSIPTFDESDRDWDSCVMKFLVFDGKDIHLIVMRGGYMIANLTFYEKLLSADAGLQPIFEKLGWPMEQVEWKGAT